MKVFATIHGLPLQQGLPQINADSFKRFNQSRITIRDQWASHPSTEDREAHLQSLNIEVPSTVDSAWTIFNHQEELQKRVTENIFEAAQFKGTVKLTDEFSFSKRYQKHIERYQLPAVYRGFFDNRLISKCDLKGIETQLAQGVKLDTLLSEEVLALPYRKKTFKKLVRHRCRRILCLKFIILSARQTRVEFPPRRDYLYPRACAPPLVNLRSIPRSSSPIVKVSNPSRRCSNRSDACVLTKPG